MYFLYDSDIVKKIILSKHYIIIYQANEKISKARVEFQAAVATVKNTDAHNVTCGNTYIKVKHRTYTTHQRVQKY